jgi:hypothetical protein
MPAYEKKGEKAETPKPSRKLDTSGSATNTLWSTDGGSRGIKRVTPGADKQSRSR